MTSPRHVTALALGATLLLGGALTACQDDDGASVRQLEDEGSTGTGSGTGSGSGTGTGSATGTEAGE